MKTINMKNISMLSCLVFILLVSYVSCHQSKEDDPATLNDSDYTDVDDIEWGNFPIAETTTKGHPVIFYKEDIVSEDYDPNKDNKSVSSSKETKPQFRRKYKDINRRSRLNRTENYRYIKPDKIYFDVYPIEYDKVNEDDSKFNGDDIQVEVISLLDDQNDNGQEESSKHQLNKRPKKVVRHHRQRRDVTNQERQVNRQQKREAHFYYQTYVPIWCATKKKLKYPVKSVYINVPKPNVVVRPTSKTTGTTNIESRFGDGSENWEIWGKTPASTTMPPLPMPTRRKPPPIIHAGDEDYGLSIQEVDIPTTTTTRRPRTTTLRPRTTYRPTTPARTTTSPPALSPTIPSPSMGSAWAKGGSTLEPAPLGIAPCIWSVWNCCKENEEIRYSCFEYLGCIGNFWDVNPCSERFMKSAAEYVNNFYDSK